MATQDGRVLCSRKNGKTSVVTDESDHKNGKQSVETDESDVSVTSMTNGQMNTNGNQHSEQECTPEQNGQENSHSHSAQGSGDSDTDTVQEHAPELDMATYVHTADVSSPEAPPCWFMDYMSVSQSNLQSNLQAMGLDLQVVSKNVQAMDIRLKYSVRVADQRFMAMQ